VTASDIPDEIGALLASLAEEPPSNVPDSVMSAALTARPNVPIQTPPKGDEVAAFGRAIDDVQRTLEVLTVAEWQLPAVNGLTVGELVGHLVGTQQAMAAELGIAEPVSAAIDHIEATRAAITTTMDLSPVAAAQRFADESVKLTAHLAGLDIEGLAAPARFGPLVADVRFLLIGRVFELWTHDNDLRFAVGRPRLEPDSDRLWMMTRAVMPLVGELGGDSVRVVLTGAGGGVWPAAGEEAAELTVESVDFCRRAANRMPLADLDCEISGKTKTVVDLLEALTTLALD
jgi:uncharacterized protein (TIGR03083 family)